MEIAFMQELCKNVIFRFCQDMGQLYLIKFPMKKSEDEYRYHIAEQFHSKLLEHVNIIF